MRLGTKILLLMLLITVGTSAVLAWVVTMNVTDYETRRAHDRITQAIGRYVTHLEQRHRQVEKIAHALLEAPIPRSQLQAADESQDPGAREQLKQEVLGRTAQTELETPEGSPAFHVIVNQASEVVSAVAPGDAKLEALLAAPDRIHWPVDPVVGTSDQLVSQYIATPEGLFLAMGIPLRTQLGEEPTHAYFVGFRVDDDWVRRQLLSERRSAGAASAGMDAPLSAWFVVDGKVVGKASSDASDTRIEAFSASTPLRLTARGALPSSRSMMAYDQVTFDNAGERYLGQSFDLKPAEAKYGRLVLASSLDQALLPLRDLQKQILLCAAVACGVAVVACRIVAQRIASPIRELMEGTCRIAGGQFDRPVDVRRRDELGTLAGAFNKMAGGLAERDKLRDERAKIERDLALARKIQMDILPKSIPPCPGYDLAAYSLPAEQAGGDIYDLVALAIDPEEIEGPPSLVLLLADATGHGVGPALSVTQVRAMLRIGVRLRAGLEHVFSQINRQLCQDLGAERFVTAFLGLLDPTAHCVNYHSAGQAPLLHFHAREKRFNWLDSSMPPLGIDENPQDEGVQRIVLEPGDLVVLLTDGFYEYQDAARELFGKERVAQVILENSHRTAKEILAELITATKSFAEGAPQMDDMTALIIKRTATSHTGPTSAAPSPAGATDLHPTPARRAGHPHVTTDAPPAAVT